MVLLLLAAVIAFLAMSAFWKTPPGRQRPFPLVWVLGVVLIALLVRLGIKWAPLAVIAYLAWTQWSRAASRTASGPAGGSRAGATSPPSEPTPGRMSREDACRVLGVQPDATPQQVLAEYRRLMKRVHPDAGGTEALAARVNEAKSVLLDG